MGLGYQIDDRFSFDYDLWFIDTNTPGLRGPKLVLGDQDYWSFSGAAQTFGRFSQQTYSHLLHEWSGTPCLNLGVSGAGPEFYLERENLLRLVEGSDAHFLQIMSGRSVSAGVFQTGSNNGVLTFTKGPQKGETMMAAVAYATLRREYGAEAYAEQISAVQKRWVELYKELLTVCRKNTYLIWMSKCVPDEIAGTFSEQSAVGEFPHFITREVVDQLSSDTVSIIDCTFRSSFPQPIRSMSSGMLSNSWTEAKHPNRPDHLRAFNVYYPNTEQHVFTAKRIFRHLMRNETS
ncbi:MAG: DUF6473 family protein [Pseudomonadota bacterium]